MRKKVRIGICFLILSFLVIPMVLAVETKVDIKTMPYRDVQVSAAKASDSSFQLIENSSMSMQANEYGDASFTFNFDDLKYNLYIYIKEEGNTIASDKQLDLVSGDSVYFEVAVSDFEFIPTPDSSTGTGSNEIDEETNATAENNSENTATDTNDSDIINTETRSEKNTSSAEDTKQEVVNSSEKSAEEEESIVSKSVGWVTTTAKNNKSYLIYGIVGIAVLVGGLFFLMKHRSSAGSSSRDSILDVESKLKQAQDELDRLKDDS